ncbi:MAG: hypothetical protein ICV60_05565 [Pyrinomonadaceae bacterium]|nr:hypothetical protein [Pyrinomonadaceae bacterium]
MTEELANQKKPIVGKVAGVVTERELAINIGKNSGVEVGMKFKVLSDKPTEVRDPETNEVLGYVDQVKVRVKATSVEDKFSLCRTYETYAIAGITSLVSILGPPRTIPKTLKAEDSAMLPPLSEEESYVKKGDRVVQILDAES